MYAILCNSWNRWPLFSEGFHKLRVSRNQVPGNRLGVRVPCPPLLVAKDLRRLQPGRAPYLVALMICAAEDPWLAAGIGTWPSHSEVKHAANFALVVAQ
jgi:hypothetical protein